MTADPLLPAPDESAPREASWLEKLWRLGALSALDYHFARSLALLGGSSDELLFCAALASRAVQLGHVCLDLRQVQELRFADPTGTHTDFVCPAAERLLRALRESPLCGDGSTPTPLVLDREGRLYLQRYALYERKLAQMLRERARPVEDVDLVRLREGLARSFSVSLEERYAQPAGPAGVDALVLAACVASLQRLAVICGGPGTGKTTTVVKILALMQERALETGGPPLHVLLLAPTGKAAQRLATSVASGLAGLALSERVRAAIPCEASTIHRALGGAKGLSGRFRHDAENPLPADVVVVDEVSMVDLALLYQLVSAIRPEARLILQGDKDQLASVEAGAILGDIYDPLAASTWSAPFAERVRRATGLALPASAPASALCDCLVSLEESHRYAKDSGIGRLARAINHADAPLALELLDGGGSGEDLDCRRFEPWARHASGEPVLEQIAIEGYAPYLRSVDPAEKLARFDAYRILCAHRQGQEGVERLNRDVERWLERAGLIVPTSPFYENRPILITRNDYALGLFNGDVGLVVRDEAGRMRVCFAGSGHLRFLAPSRLPPHETVFAMTIHKSQGSEFDAVSIVLPEAPSSLVSRELLYTAVTRARRRVDVFAPAAVIRSAVARAIQRASGLHEALWGDGAPSSGVPPPADAHGRLRPGG